MWSLLWVNAKKVVGITSNNNFKFWEHSNGDVIQYTDSIIACVEVNANAIICLFLYDKR